MIDWTTQHISFGTKTIAAGAVVNFTGTLPEAIDDSETIIVRFAPYVSGGSSTQAILSGAHYGLENGTANLNFWIRNGSNISQTWSGWADVVLIHHR